MYPKTHKSQDSPTIIPNNEMDEKGFGILKYTFTTTDYPIEQLYQDNPRTNSTFTRYTNRSLTDSLESFQNRAWKELVLLRQNNRVALVDIIWHLYLELSVKDIIKLRTKVFRYLEVHGIEAVVCIELTRGKDGRPNNTAHFHFLIDDPRSEHKIRELFNTAYERNGLVRGIDFRIDYQHLYDG
jgi:hypothetical protein